MALVPLGPGTPRLGPRQLAALWEWEEITLVLDRPPVFEDGPWFPAALRGAIGRRLLADMDLWPDAEDPFDRDGAYETLFQPAGALDTRDEIPKPFVLIHEAGGNAIRVRLRLFGMAMPHRDVVATALARAAQVGLPLREGGRNRVPFAVAGLTTRRRVGVFVPEGAPVGIGLRFHTPLCVRHGDRVVDATEGLFIRLVERVRGMAVWLPGRLELSPTETALAAALRPSRADLWPARWQRHSIRQPGRPIPMAGFVGTVEYENVPPLLLPILAVAETCHVGGHCALGLGRFEVLWPPTASAPPPPPPPPRLPPGVTDDGYWLTV